MKNRCPYSTGSRKGGFGAKVGGFPYFSMIGPKDVRENRRRIETTTKKTSKRVGGESSTTGGPGVFC